MRFLKLHRTALVWALCLSLVAGGAFLGLNSWDHQPAEARTHVGFIGGHVGTAASAGWSTWTEDSEASLASDNVYVCFFENAAAGNETGQGGGLSGVSLILTQNGAVSGATSTYRILDGVNDEFVCAAGLLDSMLAGQAAWTIIVKIADISGVDAYDRIFDLRDGDESEVFMVRDSSTGKLDVYAKSGTSVFLNATTTDSYSTSGVLYFVLCMDGTKSLGGFTSTRPTKLSDFVATKRITSMTGGGTITAGTKFTLAVSFFSDDGSSKFLPGKAYYIVIAKECLIDLNS